ncbi:hypothetical protein BN7_193 [Wickerhamomyces ciferrii]|uniref:Velvet domain-containing protein n=1 Tax=Wickerhamomyces ciferrii (strain ATCC 14091 / BCRC 22168 / CBS 111 / JCM 3599 / NBRC 0793 / NRRL Y-1031 F-60-10) TaxID=1206466 RepID=K0KGZ3_WICCF|nr:uncharacterized protein BN7_193 [Wickerhamomyces ciferrii]CCH40659.1 hypothetical protein BN7_193 [Wickerhamomyces ciferrii]
MAIGSTQKSSIGFLLSGPPAEETVSIGPKTSIRSTNAKRRQIIRPKNPKFSLKLIQQPSHAKVSPRPPSRVFPPFSEHRPIHPPPVLQLRVDDFKFKNDPAFLDDDFLDRLHDTSDPRSSERIEELKIIKDMRSCKIPSWAHYSTFFVTVRLQTVKGQNEKVLFNNKAEKSVDDLLIGIKVCSGMAISLRTSSPANSFLNKTLPGEKPKSSNYAIAFVFSDLSVRKIGTFNLKFDLFEVFQGKIYWRNELVSDNFTVYTPKKFPGSFPSTALTSFLYKHGARIRQRKRVNNSNNRDNNGSTRKFAELEDDQDEDSNYSMRRFNSSSSTLKNPPEKLPKIQDGPFMLYQQPAQHQSYQTVIQTPRPVQFYQISPINSQLQPPVQIHSQQKSQSPHLQPSPEHIQAPQQTKLPSVGHFHEPVYVYPPSLPQHQHRYQRVLPQHMVPAPPLQLSQQQSGVTYAYQTHDPNQTPTLIQRIPITTGPYYQQSSSMFTPQHPMVHQVQQIQPIQHLPQHSHQVTTQQLSPRSQQGQSGQTLSQIQQVQTSITIQQQQHQQQQPQRPPQHEGKPLIKPTQSGPTSNLPPQVNGYTNFNYGQPNGQ